MVTMTMAMTMAMMMMVLVLVVLWSRLWWGDCGGVIVVEYFSCLLGGGFSRLRVVERGGLKPSPSYHHDTPTNTFVRQQKILRWYVLLSSSAVGGRGIEVGRHLFVCFFACPFFFSFLFF
jgi:hypothetical protein